jgi:hypothetical protein
VKQYLYLMVYVDSDGDPGRNWLKSPLKLDIWREGEDRETLLRLFAQLRKSFEEDDEYAESLETWFDTLKEWGAEFNRIDFNEAPVVELDEAAWMLALLET